MKRRSQKLEILLDVQAVTCPGVWIPCNGGVYLSICLLGRHIRTKEAAPYFPMHFNQKYIVQKVFLHVLRLSELDQQLDAEVVYVELVQRFAERSDAVLATFETSARELLFPRTELEQHPRAAGADLDLLMEPTVNFVGTEPPRLELSTKTTVKEVRTPLPPPSALRSGSAGAVLAVPMVVRGRAPGERPPFRWRRVEPAMLGRQVGAAPPSRQPRRRWRSQGAVGGGRHCHCSCPTAARGGGGGGGGGGGDRRSAVASSSGGPAVRARSVEPLSVSVEGETRPGRPSWCAHCRKRHTLHHCTVCEAYRRYFGRDYPGHYHHDCCNCLCPITVDGVKHVCGRSQTQLVTADRARPATAPSEANHSESNLAQVWQDYTETSSPRHDRHRRDFYENLEHFYRRMYSRAATSAVCDALRD